VNSVSGQIWGFYAWPFKPRHQQRLDQQFLESDMTQNLTTKSCTTQPPEKPDTRHHAVECGDDGVLKVDRALVRKALGSEDERFILMLADQVANVHARDGKANSRSMDFIWSVIEGIEPRDQVEAMLAAQMAAVHMASMTFARRLNHVQTIPQQDSAEKTLNKLMRTFTAQMEALRRYRTGGEQKVTVQHVHVNEGGQAVVGNVSNNGKGGGVGGKN
jgi:hypothetical protein